MVFIVYPRKQSGWPWVTPQQGDNEQEACNDNQQVLFQEKGLDLLGPKGQSKQGQEAPEEGLLWPTMATQRAWTFCLSGRTRQGEQALH